MSNTDHTEYIISEVLNRFSTITLSGYFDSKTLEYKLDTNSNIVDKDILFEMCKESFVANKNKKSVNIEFSNKKIILFHYTGDNKWVILGGRKILSHQVKAFLNELWIVKKGLEEIRNGVVVKSSEESLKKDREVFDRFPKIWGKKNFTEHNESEDVLDSLQRSAQKLRRKQYVKLHNELKSAEFEKLHTNHFLISNVNLEESVNFYSYRKLDGKHYFFLAKSNHPKLDSMVHYSSLSTYINNIDGNKPVDRERVFKEMKDIVNNFVVDFDEDTTNDHHDNIAIFTQDEQTNIFGFSMQGYYVSNITSLDQPFKTLIYKNQDEYHSGEIPVVSSQKHIIFSEELLDLFDGDIEQLETAFINYAQNPNLTKSFMDEELESIQKKKNFDKRPDFLLFYSEMK